ncbi:hypothetical protein NL676_018576 [Syzygium grande]|nr:hypothetical protein NL676_018576 [Syzygium grande]
MEKGKQVMGNGVSDWPNPGNTWRWWVGKRTNSSGFYKDRVVHLPKRLRAYGVKRTYSKSSLERYISLQFPDLDIDELFASFSWMVPSTEHRWSEDLHPDLLSKVPLVASKRNKEAPWNSRMTKKARPATSQAFPRRSTRQSNKIPAQNNTRSEESVIDLCFLTDDSASDGSGYSKCGSKPQIDLEDVAPDQSISSSCYASKDFEAQDVLISQRKCLLTTRSFLPFLPWISRACCPHLEQITFLVEKLVADPILTIDQLLKLKLVEEIPKAGKVFQRTKGLADQASNFFGELQVMKDKVSSIKREFSELKKGTGELQSQIDSKSSLVREIDEQIAQLQSRKAELTHDLESTNKVKLQVVAEQKIVVNSISAVTRDIQTASAEIPVWEMKKKNAEKRMAEILTRYAPLKGLSFEKSC